MSTEALVTFLYSLVPVLSGIAYVPQAVSLWRATPSEARSVSLGAWSLWVFTATMSLLYGLVVVKDLMFCIVSGASVFWCCLICGIAVWKRWFA